jgi:hypothetical protein
LEPGATVEMARDLEQYYIDTLSPDLNEEVSVTRPGMASKTTQLYFDLTDQNKVINLSKDKLITVV